jgi:hypothetical protein
VVAKHQQELHDVDIQLRKATTDQLEAQQRGEPSSLQKIADLAAQKHQITEAQKAAEREHQQLPPDAPAPQNRHKRVRKLPWKLRQD